MMISDVIVRIQKRGKEGTEKERRKRGGGPSRVEGGGGESGGGGHDFKIIRVPYRWLIVWFLCPLVERH